MNQHQSINPFLPVLDTWEDYFSNPDEGLGTTYERFLLHGIFSMIAEQADIETILEVPAFGMTGISGINSIWWAKQGKRVTIVDDNEQRVELIRKTWQKINLPAEVLCHNPEELPFPPGAFDLVWNFAALWFVKDLERFANRVKQTAGKVILICVPNTRGLGYLLRKKYAVDVPQIHLSHIQPKTVKRAFSGEGWQLWKQGIFDVPPWPDIPMKKEDLLARLKLNWVAKRLVAKRKNETGHSGWCILDFFSGKNPGMEGEILRYGMLEHAPRCIKNFWGHHRYFIFINR